MSDTQHTPWPELAKQIDAVFADRDRLSALNAELVSALEDLSERTEAAFGLLFNAACKTADKDEILDLLHTDDASATLAKARGES